MATVAENTKVLIQALGMTNRRVVRPRVERVLHETADYIIDIIDNSFQPQTYKPGGNEQYPIWSGNMRDATGVGVYEYGKLTKYKPMAMAEGTQKGSDFLEEALQAGTTTYNKGMHIVLFSAAPYAEYINEQGSKLGRGVGFYDMLKNYLIEEINISKQSINASVRAMSR